ncbi:YpmS family protein [Alkalicoccus saliphilus]|jgi:uncharacterized protein YpmS|uniref:DUF2140 domain-containing protein n=1 Tax=Alkalicoccus saliphilus TaxID=200989 RepID=A0A2T4U6B5_9BACI|nr:YpmS family protein [Alkalicoccus saliphilus]PTL38948.1 hypothetical protein C6Y45_08175 [Alkalicoccus saliphilus]
MNVWKTAFFGLLGLILVVIAGGWLWVNQSLDSTEEESFVPPDHERTAPEQPEFLVSSTREDANAWLQRELEEEENMDDFDLIIDDAVYFQSEISAFGFDIPVEVRFNPEVAEDGNVWLREDGFQVGFVELPAEQIFNLIGDRLELPEWISVVPEESSLYLDMREMHTEDYIIEAETLDLEENDIQFRIIAAE